MHVIYFFALTFFISQHKFSVVYIPNQKISTANTCLQRTAQRVARTRVTQHTAEHPPEAGSAVSHTTHSRHGPGLFHVGHEYRTLGLWRRVRRGLLTATYCEKLIFIWPTNTWLRSLIMVTKTMAVILSMASYACCGGNINHATPLFSPFPFGKFCSWSSEFAPAKKLIHSNTGCCREIASISPPLPTLHQAENTSGQLPLKFLPNMSLICVVHDISPQLKLTC